MKARVLKRSMKRYKKYMEHEKITATLLLKPQKKIPKLGETMLKISAKESQNNEETPSRTRKCYKPKTRQIQNT